MNHSLRPHRRAAFAAVIAGALALAACGSDTPNSSPAPTSAGTGPGTSDAPSGTITVYSGRSEELVKPLLDQFSEATGITVEFRPADSGELAAQLITEGEASPADVFFSQDAGALGAVEAVGLFAPLPESTLSVVPAAYRSSNGMWVGTSGRARVFVVNPTLAPDPPTTIDELLDPQWNGKIGFAPTNASWQAFVTGLRVIRGDDGARTWLEAFAAQEPVAYEKNSVVRDAVNSGEVAIGLVNHYYLFELIAAEGADAVVAVNQYAAPGDPGGLVNVAGVGVLSSSDNPNAALALVEYLLSVEGQTFFAQTTFEYPLRAGVATAEGVPSLDTLSPPEIDLGDLASLEATQELLSDVGLLTL